MDGLFGDGLVDVLCCCGDSLEEVLGWGPRLGALVDLVEFEDGVTNGGVAFFKIVEAFSRGAFFFSTSAELKTMAAGWRRSWPWNDGLKHIFACNIDP